MKAKITKRIVDTTAATKATGDIMLWDTEVSGFGVRFWPTGGKIYQVKARVNGKQRWFTIGRHGSWRLWKVALSMTMTVCLESFGNKSCSTHAVKTSAFTFSSNKPNVSKHRLSNAPMTFVRPFACQSCVP